MDDYNTSKVDWELLEKVYEKLKQMGRNPRKLSSKDKLVALCPFHNDHEPSFYIYEYNGRLYYKCFGCGKHGSIWKLAKELEILLPKAERTKKKQKEGVKIPPNLISKIVEKAHEIQRSFYEAKPNAEVREADYFVQRGFLTPGQSFKDALTFVNKYYLGIVDEEVVQEIPEMESFKGRLIIPYFDLEGNPVWFVGRAVVDEEELAYEGLPAVKYLQPKDMSPRVYNPIAIDQAMETGYLLVVEGAIDTISVLEATDNSIPVVGVPGGGVSSPKVKEFFKQVAEAGIDVIILTDPDAGGRKIASRLKKMIREYDGIAIQARLWTPEGEPWNRDVNEALIKYGKNGISKMINEVIERYDSVGDEWFVKHFHIIVKKERKKAVYPTGIKKIDEYLGGGYRAGLHIIGGNTATGKTAFALHVAVHNALKGNPVLYFTYEQSQKELWGRIITSNTDEVSYFDIKDGEIPPIIELEAADTLLKIARNLKICEGDSGMFDEYETLYTVEEIAHEARRVKEKTGKPPLVIVDYIQRMPTTEELKRKDLRERVDFIVTGLQTHVARVNGMSKEVFKRFYEISK